MGYASKDIRNILVAGHAGCGKTTLTEALLYMSGATERMGRVEDGTTASDFDPEETRRKASLNASVVPVEYEGTKYNLIDAPGLFDFETGAAEGIMAAESVLICVSGRSGVTVGAEKAYQLALKNNKARMIFVTKTDLENADYFKILEQMKIKFGPSVCPCVVPVRLDDGTVAYINLFSQKAFKYEGGKQKRERAASPSRHHHVHSYPPFLLGARPVSLNRGRSFRIPQARANMRHRRPSGSRIFLPPSRPTCTAGRCRGALRPQYTCRSGFPALRS